MYIAILTLLNGDLYDARVFHKYRPAVDWAKWVTRVQEKSRVGNFKINIIKREVEEG